MAEANVRIADVADAQEIAAIYAPIVAATAISFEIDPPSVDEMAERIARTLRTHPWLVAERGGSVIGYAYAASHRDRAAYRWSVDVTVYVSEGARRTGVGRDIYGALMGVLRRQGFRSAFAGIALPNPGSVALHQALGFEPLGVYRQVGFKLGGWLDVGWWRLGLSDDPGPPKEPTAFSELRAQHGFRL